MISHQKKFIFIHIPRTGGTHLCDFLLPYCDEESLKFSPFGKDEHQHATLLEYVDYYGKEILDYTIFSIVRNPWDRALSLSLKHNDGIFDREHFRKVVYHPYRYSHYPHSHFTFFLKKIPLDPDGKPQIYKAFHPFTSSEEMQVLYELFHWPYFLQFEDYVEDVTQIFDKLDIKYDIEKLKTKSNSTSHKHYSHYYDDDEKEAIAYACALDLQMFGYTFDDRRNK